MAELASLHRAVASMPAGRRRHRWGPRTLGLFMGLGALTTTGTAFALEGGHLPQPVVSVARTMGLPVSKPAPVPPPITVPAAPVVSPPRSPVTTAPRRPVLSTTGPPSRPTSTPT